MLQLKVFYRIGLILALFTIMCFARIHRLDIRNDVRKYIELSSFGFYQGGMLHVRLKNFRATPQNESAVFGFSLDVTTNYGMSSYANDNLDQCILQMYDPAVFYLILDLQANKLRLKCGEQALLIYKGKGDILTLLPVGERRTREETHDGCSYLNFDITSKVVEGNTYYNASFAVSLATSSKEGVYNLYFHNCPNYKVGTAVSLNFTAEIIEQNQNSFLSAGEMPLPAAYSITAILFFLSAIYWAFFLRQTQHPVVNIHYMMEVLVFLKAITVAFTAVEYLYIESFGMDAFTWRVLFYVANVLKGVLFSVVVMLVGAGWTFFKQELAQREKCLVMVVIPLQVFSNVLGIIIRETEQIGNQHITLKQVFIVTDLLCCCIILLPGLWSIRHLRKAPSTETNRRLLKRFRLFYIALVFYVYSTRILVYLPQINLTFQYEWLREMFRETVTYAFFVLTAYMFRPGYHNPCQALAIEEDNKALIESGATENLRRVNYLTKNTCETL